MDASKHNAYAAIDLEALKHNLSVARAQVGNDTAILAVVKADAYGHGAQMVATALAGCGVTNFAVANVEEGVALRKIGIRGMILVLGAVLPEQITEAIAHELSLSVNSTLTLTAIADTAARMNRPVRLHLKLDTGMNRLGFKASAEGALSDELLSAAKMIRNDKRLIPEGVFSHLCDADNEDDSYTRRQIAAFSHTVRELENCGLAFEKRHLCSTAATFRYPEAQFDMIRFGIGLYGCEFGELGVKPVMSFKTHITELHEVEKGEKIGYGLTYEAPESRLIATVSAGYADGVPRLLSGKGILLCRGKRVPIVGRVCMDMMMADVTDVPGVSLYDEVTIFGTDGEEQITAEEVASLAGTISYEILCGVGKRVVRVYQ